MFTVEEINSDLIKNLENSRTYGFVKVRSTKNPSQFCVIPRKMVDQYLERIQKMEVYEDDVWIVSFPKCGTTWTQEMLWMLNNNLDYKKAEKVKQHDRFPFIE